MTLSDSAVGTALKPTTFQWDQTDVILYALGVGARPPAELALLNEACGPAVLPTFALIANWWAVKDLRSVLDLGASSDLDVAGVDFLTNLHRDLAHDNRELWVTHAQPKVAALIATGELRDVIAPDQVWPTNRDALQAFRRPTSS